MEVLNAHDYDQRQQQNLLQGLGTGQLVVSRHGWPLSADAWEDQMVFLASHGYRAIVHDRRGRGRSSQPSDGNNMDSCADTLQRSLKRWT
jgi:non-heme chloroperoxidase